MTASRTDLGALVEELVVGASSRRGPKLGGLQWAAIAVAAERDQADRAERERDGAYLTIRALTKAGG